MQFLLDFRSNAKECEVVAESKSEIWSLMWDSESKLEGLNQLDWEDHIKNYCNLFDRFPKVSDYLKDLFETLWIGKLKYNNIFLD